MRHAPLKPSVAQVSRDVEARTLEVSRLSDGNWLELATYGADEKVRAEPFGAIEIDLSSWWADLPETDTP